MTTNSDVQFTPGPWMVHDTVDGPLSNTDVRDSRNRWVARCCALYGRPHADEAEANARLIAAAPKLLAALEAFVDSDNTDSIDTRYENAWQAIDEARGAHD